MFINFYQCNLRLHGFEKSFDIFLGMVSEQQKYISSGFKNVGFALSAPAGSILFQWFVFEKPTYFAHFLPAVLVFLLGFLFLCVGYKILRER